MPQQNLKVGDKCSFCSDGIMVLSKAGKLYCNKKCWLKNQSATSTAPSSQTNNVSREVWEAKDRLSAMQTALNCASNVNQQSGDAEKTIQDAKKYYNLLRQAKQGLIQRENPNDPTSETETKGTEPIDISKIDW